MPVLGMRGTGSFSADDRPKNYRDMLLLQKPNTPAALTAFIGRTRNEPTDDPEFKVFTKGLPTQRALVSGAQTTGELTIELQGTDQNKLFKPGHAVINERTLEVFWVTASSTANVLTVVRAKGSTGLPMNDGDGLLILSSHQQEGAAIPTAVSYDPAVIANFTQIFRTAVNLTGTVQATRLRYADNPLVEMKREALEIHSIEMEKQFLFGSGLEDVGGAQPERTTKGLYFFVTTNLKDFADAVDVDSWENWLEDVFEDGSEEKLFLCGNRHLNVLKKLARVHSQITMPPRSETYGMMMQTYVTPYGTLQIRQHPLLSKNPTFNDWGFLIDPAHVVYRYLRGRDTKYLTARQNPGDDVVTDEFMTECGLECQFEVTMGVSKNASTFIP